GGGIHPHSGIATITVLLQGDLHYEDTTGKSGILPAGGVEWMRAGAGVWHDGAPLPGAHLRGLQLWIALPAALEHAPAQSQYVTPQSVPQEGPVRVILGRYGKAKSQVLAPSGVNYLDVRLKDGETCEYPLPSAARRSSFPTTSCLFTPRPTPAPSRSPPVKPRSGASASASTFRWEYS